MGCNTKRRKRFMKLELFETSAVGTPAYAHAQYGFAKSLSKQLGDERRFEEQEKMAEEEAPKEEVKVEETPVAPVETPVETPVTPVEEPKPAEPTEEAKAIEARIDKIVAAKVDEMLEKKADSLFSKFEDAISKLSVQRGLVETSEKKSTIKSVEEMSNGELFLAILNNK